MSSMVQCYALAVDPPSAGHSEGDGNLSDLLEVSFARYETCFWVGDLYEAWALYQFGKMTLDLIQASIRRMHRSQVREDRERADPLLVAHSAVEAIAWLGVTLFLLVCISQA